MDARAAGRLLAARHADPVPPDPECALVAYAESPRAGDWSLRSALVRLAQPDPVRAGAVLELIRWCDGGVRPYTRLLERTSVWCDRALTLEGVGGGPVEPCADGRATDLARVARSAPTLFDGVIAGYAAETDLGDEELAAVPLLVIALDLDELADVLTDWADAGPDDPPLRAVDEACHRVFDALAEAGVPRETRPAGMARRGRPD